MQIAFDFVDWDHCYFGKHCYLYSSCPSRLVMSLWGNDRATKNLDYTSRLVSILPRLWHVCAGWLPFWTVQDVETCRCLDAEIPFQPTSSYEAHLKSFIVFLATLERCPVWFQQHMAGIVLRLVDKSWAVKSAIYFGGVVWRNPGEIESGEPAVWGRESQGCSC